MGSKFAHHMPVEFVTCRACGEKRSLDDYRLFATTPKKQWMDFCVHCEQREGTLTLYRRYSGYGTPEIITAVYAAERTPELHRTGEMSRLLVSPKDLTPPETNEEVVQRELARRELARRRLIYFVTTFHKNYSPGWVHQDICRRLERFVAQVEAGQSPRLMIFCPPRLGKSALASDYFPSWVLGKHPDWSIIATSYAQSLPVGFSRNIRARFKDPEFQAVFKDARLSPDGQGVEAWFTTQNGGYIAAGIGTGITGKGGNILIYDDPVKDQEAADSEVIRKATYDWYQSTFRTRLAPGGGILGIQTRWHYADLSGRLLEDDEMLAKAGVPATERENWEVVSYPALAESDEYLLRDGTILQGTPEKEDDVLRLLRRKGEAIHPERYTTADMRRLRNVTSPSVWTALYQQRPTPEEGDFFKREDFVYRWLDPAYMPLCRVFMVADYAIGKKRRNDFTALGVFALDADDNLYLVDIRRDRWGTFDIANNIVALIERYKPEVYAGEQGAIHQAVWPVVQKELDNKRLYITVDESLTPMQDKEVRARPLQGRVQRRKLFFSYDAATKPEVYDIVEREMLQFPNGAHDDTVDVLAWAARLALNIALPTKRSVPKTKSWEDELLAEGSSNDFMAA